MKFSKKKATELFIEAWEYLSAADAVAVHNIWARENDSDLEIFNNSEDFINEFFRTPYEAIAAVCYGEYGMADPFVWFDGYANLNTSFLVPPFVDKNELADWYIDKHWDELPPEFREFCEYMDAADDEEAE